MQYYSRTGLRKCLVIQSQDPTAEYLLGQKIGTTPTPIGNGTLQAVRLESTKMLLEPLHRLKKADARLNLSQGVLDEVGKGRVHLANFLRYHSSSVYLVKEGELLFQYLDRRERITF